MRSFFLLLLFVLGSCGSPAAAGQGGAPPRPVEVGVVTLAAADLTLTRELPGRVTALRVAEVRARVNGIVEKRLFEEGSDVEEGQALYRIESAPYEASLASAQASLARAVANLAMARTTAGRNEALLQSNTVSREEVDTAEATLKAAEADAAAGRAAVRTARINRAYTVVEAPVSGRIGRSAVTEGAYVQQATATLMVTVQQLDPVYVDVTWSSTEVMRLRRDVETGKVKGVDGQAETHLVFDDGREYPEVGKLQFTDVTVDPTTGSILLRALFPNPRGDLLPGLFVRARIEEGTSPAAILVPQRAVTRDANGRATALVVTAEKKVERRILTSDRQIGDAWLVTAGVVAGEQVIVEGLQKVRPGSDVNAVPVDKRQAANQ